MIELDPDKIINEISKAICLLNDLGSQKTNRDTERVIEIQNTLINVRRYTRNRILLRKDET